jgi:glycosyltransferase involved in cell wall biosynthesis
VLTELGLAAGVHGEEQQADSLAWQLLTVDELGCAGACVFSWTDEWAVADVPVEGWGFGLTDEGRDAKPALDVVRSWASLRLVDLRSMWPRVSVVVCAHNEAATIEECLGSLAASDYPDLEVLLCDDGSTDGTPELAERFPCRIIRLEHGGLSAARNTGIEQATGEIVAFLDADATCHSEWPYHLALSLEGPNVVATGGPNLAVADAPFVERAVAASPGGPVEVLLSHDRAEHVPGCNMAYRKDALEEIGGFDPIYRAAGDDVDVCWKLLERGHEIAFAPAAQVRHHRRGTVRAYLRQQRSYGRAERMLAGRWRHHMNRLGQARWKGSLYGGPHILPTLLRPVVYHGWMGFAPFQGVTRDRHHAVLGWLSALSPVMVPLAALGLLAPFSLWFLAAPLIALAGLTAFGASIAAAVEPARTEPRRRRFKALVGLLHVVQPMVRTWGRLRGTPAEPLPERRRAWMGDRALWLAELKRNLGARHCRVRAARPDQAWDLVVSVGPLLACRLTTAVTWGWTPHSGLSWRLRWSGLPVIAVLAATAVFDLRAAALLLVFSGILAIVETVGLRVIVGGAVAATTNGAFPYQQDARVSDATPARDLL